MNPFLTSAISLMIIVFVSGRLLIQTVAAADAGNPLPNTSWSDFLSVKGLEINPKLITGTDGENTTFGVEYKFAREIRPRNLGLVSDDTELGISLHSEGLIVADEQKSPNQLIAHTFRLSAIDLLPSRWNANEATRKENQALMRRIDTEFFQPWQTMAESLKKLSTDPLANRSAIQQHQKDMAALSKQAASELKDYGELSPDVASRMWWIKTSKGTKDWATEVMSKVIKERVVFLTSDLDGSVEHNQSFDSVQFVGSAQIRGKLLIPFLDYPFVPLRLIVDSTSDGKPKNFLNRNGGPYFWGGIGVVDASGNDARTALTDDHQTFPRAHFGVFYRTEVLAVSESKAVALELQWRYFHEFNAPAAIRARKLDNTSYFKATLLFPGNYFLEYTDGKLPIDVEGASTVSVGWRYNF